MGTDHREGGDVPAWFLDTDYNGESFFVRHAYFTGADQPYEKLVARHPKVPKLGDHCVADPALRSQTRRSASPCC